MPLGADHQPVSTNRRTRAVPHDAVVILGALQWQRTRQRPAVQSATIRYWMIRRHSAVGVNSAQPLISGFHQEHDHAHFALVNAGMRVVAFYNHRGTAEQHIKEGKNGGTRPRLGASLNAATANRSLLSTRSLPKR